ncbi:hypothetical protein ERD95_15440 [Enterobacteriaceae bacterium ML5]|nr:hypothetical protein ERD95_15440 [Enterobacteriaceae bacterium ML5]
MKNSRSGMYSCDFCGRNQKEVLTLIRGQNDVAICNACILVGLETLIDATKLRDMPEPVQTTEQEGK